MADARAQFEAARMRAETRAQFEAAQRAAQARTTREQVAIQREKGEIEPPPAPPTTDVDIFGFAPKTLVETGLQVLPVVTGASPLLAPGLPPSLAEPIQPPRLRDVREGAVSAAPEILGTAGAIAGGTLGSGGAMGGAMLGGMAGEVVRQGVGDVRAGPVLASGVEQGVLEGLGIGGTKVLGIGANKLVGKRVAHAIESDALLRGVAVQAEADLVKAGHAPDVARGFTRAALLSAQATHGNLLELASNLALSSTFGGRFKEVKRVQDELFKMLPGIISRRIAPLMEKGDVARSLIRAFENVAEVEEGRMGAMHNLVSNRLRVKEVPTSRPDVTSMVVVETGGAEGLVNLRPVKRALARQRKAFEELDVAVLDPEGVGKVIDTIDGLPVRGSFESVKTLRSDLQRLVAEVSFANPKSNFLAAAGEVNKLLGREMKTAVREFDRGVAARRARRGATGPALRPVAPILDLANTATVDFHNRSGHALVRGWMEAVNDKLVGPEVIDQMIKDNNADRIKLIKSILRDESFGPKDDRVKYIDMLRSWHVKDMLDRSGRVPSGAALRDIVEKETGRTGPAVVRELHGNAAAKNYRAFARALETAQSKDTSSGGFIMQMIEGGAGVGAFATLLSPGDTGDREAIGFAGGIAISMYTLSRLLASPRTARFVIDGAQFGPKTKRGAAAFLRLVSHLARDEYIELPPSGTAMSPAQAQGLFNAKAQLAGE